MRTLDVDNPAGRQVFSLVLVDGEGGIWLTEPRDGLLEWLAFWFLRGLRGRARIKGAAITRTVSAVRIARRYLDAAPTLEGATTATVVENASQ